MGHVLEVARPPRFMDAIVASTLRATLVTLASCVLAIMAKTSNTALRYVFSPPAGERQFFRLTQRYLSPYFFPQVRLKERRTMRRDSTHGWVAALLGERSMGIGI